MTDKEKKLVLKDLSARLPYGVKCKVVITGNPCIPDVTLYTKLLERVTSCFYEIKPYLRPMENMTEGSRTANRKLRKTTKNL